MWDEPLEEHEKEGFRLLEWRVLVLEKNHDLLDDRYEKLYLRLNQILVAVVVAAITIIGTSYLGHH
jgi:hypothetical protein